MDAVDVLAAGYRLSGFTGGGNGLALLEHVGFGVIFGETADERRLTVEKIHYYAPINRVLEHRFAKQCGVSSQD